jgi:hypothetical protein
LDTAAAVRGAVWLSTLSPPEREFLEGIAREHGWTYTEQNRRRLLYEAESVGLL